jgi:hypothetical protein
VDSFHPVGAGLTTRDAAAEAPRPLFDGHAKRRGSGRCGLVEGAKTLKNGENLLKKRSNLEKMRENRRIRAVSAACFR